MYLLLLSFTYLIEYISIIQLNQFHLLDNKFIDKIEFAVAPWVRNSDKFDLRKYEWQTHCLQKCWLAVNVK